MNNLAYILVTSELPNNVVLNHIKALKKKNYDVTLLVPDRGYGCQFSNYYKTIKMDRLNFRYRNDSFFKYAISLIKYIFLANLKLISHKPNIIVAVDFEGSLASVASIFFKCKKYALVNDNFCIRYKLPKFISYFVKLVESLNYSLADIVIVPHSTRAEFIKFINKSKIRVIPNLINNKHKLTWNPSPSKSILLCGWLNSSRGLDIFLSLIERLPHVDFIVAGELESVILEKLLLKQNVQYYEHMPHDEMLIVMSKCWLNFAFYNPAILINIYAQPQKIYDSLSIGVPLFLNSEMLLAIELASKNACLKAPYGDIESIIREIEFYLINDNGAKLKQISLNSLAYYVSSDLLDVERNIEKLYE